MHVRGYFIPIPARNRSIHIFDAHQKLRVITMSAQIQSEVLLPESEREPTTPSGSDRHSPMRVLLFDHTAQLGGGEIALLDLIRFFDRSRVTPIVVLGSDGPLADRLRGLVDLHI